MPRPKNLTGQRKALKMRLSGRSVRDVASRLGVSESTISAWTKGLIPLEERHSQTFLDRDSELRSYFLGLFVADGWVSGHQAYIALNDRQIIKALAAATSYKSKIGKIPLRKWKSKEFSGNFSYRLNYGRRIASAMKTLGFVPKKTGNEFIPAGVSNDTFRHFARGFTDGDGSMSLVMNRGRRILQWTVVSSSKRFLLDMFAKLRPFINSRLAGVNKKKPSMRQRQIGGKRRKKMYRIQLGHCDSILLGEYLYQDSNICLRRKRDAWIVGKDVPQYYRRWSDAEIKQARRGVAPNGRTKYAYYSMRYLFGLGKR